MLTQKEFEVVFRDYYKELRIYARHFILDVEVANDIVQEVYCNLWKMNSSFQHKGPLKGYLYSSVYYKCLNFLKHQTVEQNFEQAVLDAKGEFSQYYNEQIETVQPTYISEEFLDKIKSVVNDLPDQCKRIFILSRKFCLKNREIAEYLDISIKVVERQLSKALQRIRQKLEEK